jgi:eukaryotic-like serine/threonine-protein kinase
VTPERWKQIQESLDIVIALTPSERESFLNQLENTDLDLREELESLLLYESKDPDFLQIPAIGLMAKSEWRERERTPLLGCVLGAYRLTELLGARGMGDVYCASRADGHYDQQVAVKIVHPSVGGEFSTIGFRNERRILAKLDHPNIAKILDGGTTADGLPYFVMEFIDGVPITEYCDRHCLSIEDRFRVFRTACSAVHYAHQHLVVHRDIKPTNILVTPEGIPKLLDFGIAKILNPESPARDATVTNVWAMTPEYASPEQLRDEPITTATDVYSLGLILYELLTGQRAHRFHSHMLAEITQSVLESEPDKPSSTILRKTRPGSAQGEVVEKPRIGSDLAQTCELRGLSSARNLHHRLTGDPDNIVLKALRKEPGARYASADQLSEDIRRHLEGLPITASKGTTAYRFRKYVLRHKAGVASAAIILLTLIVALVLTLREGRVARQNEFRAQRRLQQTRELTTSLIGELPATLEEGPTQAKALMNAKALEYLKQLIEEESRDPKLSLDLALAHLQLAEALGNPGMSSKGDVAGALENYRRAIGLFEEQLRTDPADSNVRVYLAHAYIGHSLVILPTNVSMALQIQKKALAILPPDEEAAGLIVRLEREQANELIGEQYGDPYFANLGDTSRALENMQKAADLAELLHKAHPDDYRSSRQLYYCEIQIAAVLWARGRNQEALEFQRRGEAMLNSMAVKGIIGRQAPQSQALREEFASLC